MMNRMETIRKRQEVTATLLTLARDLFCRPPSKRLLLANEAEEEDDEDEEEEKVRRG